MIYTNFKRTIAVSFEKSHMKQAIAPGSGPNLLIISFPPAIGGGERRDFNYFGTRPSPRR
ncbi:MAG: hypothetical protein LBR79_03450 [Oscillospiraceae bacterium]|nr:hypothetical protein [Oscillospiraceae bacterium]